MLQDSQTSVKLPLNQWRLHWKCPKVDSCNSFTSCKIQKNNSIYSMKLRIWSYIKTSSNHTVKKQHLRFLRGFSTKKSIFTRGKSPDFGPDPRWRLVIPDPFLSARRAIETRFYAPPRVTGSVSLAPIWSNIPMDRNHGNDNIYRSMNGWFLWWISKKNKNTWSEWRHCRFWFLCIIPPGDGGFRSH